MRPVSTKLVFRVYHRWPLALIVVCGLALGLHRSSPRRQAQTESRAAEAAEPLLHPPPRSCRSRRPPPQGDMAAVYLTGLGTAAPPTDTVTVQSTRRRRRSSQGRLPGRAARSHRRSPAELDPRPFQVQLAQARGTGGEGPAALENAPLRPAAAPGARSSRTRHPDSSSTRRRPPVNPAGRHALKSDQAQIESAKLNLTTAGITAPITGRVGLRLVDPGNIVHASDQQGWLVITQLASRSRWCSRSPRTACRRCSRPARAGRPPAEVEALRPRRQVADRRRILLAVGRQPDRSERPGTVKLKAAVSESGRRASSRTSSSTRASVVDTIRGTVIASPSAAIQRSPQSTFVYVVERGQHRRDLRTVDRAAHRRRPRPRVSARPRSPGNAVVADGVGQAAAGREVGSRGQPSQARNGPRRGGESMSPSRPFILRPVATSLLMAGLLLRGRRRPSAQLPVSALPQVDYPTIQVVTFYPGRQPRRHGVVAVTAPLERQFGQLPGLNQMTSTSSIGQLGHHAAVRARPQHRRRRAARCRRPSTPPAPTCRATCPTRPIYSKTNPADAPILTLALTSRDAAAARRCEDFADTRFAQKISQLPGVGLVSISGGQKPAVRIQANPTALASYGLTLEDVRTAVAQSNVNQAKGSLRRHARRPTRSAPTISCSSSDQYRPLIVAYRNGAPVRLARRRRRSIDGAGEREAGRLDERRARGHRQHPAAARREHHRASSTGSRRCCRSSARRCPPPCRSPILTDRTTTIRASVADVEFELMLTIALVVMVIFLFLRTLVGDRHPERRGPAVARRHLRRDVPARLQPQQPHPDGADDLDRLRRRRRDRDDREHHALHRGRRCRRSRRRCKGAEQIGFTILSLTVSLIAVLIPLLFMGDVVGPSLPRVRRHARA